MHIDMSYVLFWEKLREEEPYIQSLVGFLFQQWTKTEQCYLATTNLSKHILLYVCRERSGVKRAENGQRQKVGCVFQTYL